MTELSAEHFTRLSQQIYLRLGLHFEESKNYFLQKRVERRMEVLGMTDPQDYVFLVCYADRDGKEMQALANLITTNETYMFREYEQLEAFANVCLPEILSAKHEKGDHTLRIWSAGCSTGEEPYTLAIILQEIFPQSVYWDCEIVASDIDENVLAVASKARYSWRSVREVPEPYMAKYLTKDGDEWVVRPKTKSLVHLRHLNLHDRIAMRAMRNFDFIFCRNVLIYFDDISRRNVVDQFYSCLNPGGYIFLGHSESIGRISGAFRLKRAQGHLLYFKEQQ